MSARKTNNRQSSWGDITFASIRLSEENKHEFEVWATSIGDGAQQEIDQFVISGWKTSTKWDDNNDCFIVSATNENDKDRNYKICVSSRSDISIEAALLNIYKVEVLYRGLKLPTEGVKQNWG